MDLGSSGACERPNDMFMSRSCYAFDAWAGGWFISAYDVLGFVQIPGSVWKFNFLTIRLPRARVQSTPTQVRRTGIVIAFSPGAVVH